MAQGNHYYKNLDFSRPMGTHRYVDNLKSRRELAKVCLVAMARICQYSNGSLSNPSELASSVMRDGRTLIQTIYEDGYVMYNDGWYIVEVDETSTLYVDVTGKAMNSCDDYKDLQYVMDKACRESHEEMMNS